MMTKNYYEALKNIPEYNALRKTLLAITPYESKSVDTIRNACRLYRLMVLCKPELKKTITDPLILEMVANLASERRVAVRGCVKDAIEDAAIDGDFSDLIKHAKEDVDELGRYFGERRDDDFGLRDFGDRKMHYYAPQKNQ